ncbi:MAG TPA: dihydroorotase [Candidatus Sulfopaludibacter sp.]|jgi:dihydroorotase|nr:dihydroorotase [Candidatus Sulfopaludibacter sp.]
MSIVIKNGRVIDPASQIDRTADVLIVDGRIAGVAPNLSSPKAQVFDATGMIVAPGFIDMHVHLREPGFEHAENIESGSRAAAAGGFTSICCMPNTKPINDSPTVTSYIVERARNQAIVNVFPIGAITKGSAGEELAALGAMKAAGAVAISDDGQPVMNSRVMRRAMEFARSYDLPVIDHCEDLNLSAGGDMHEGIKSVRWGLRGIPAASEDVMVARDLILAQLTGARYHVAHISTRNAVAMVEQARRLGLPVTCEATPHHFALSDEAMLPYDSNYKMKPPLRSCAHRDAVMDGIVAGTIGVIATDHAPHAGSEKMQEFERCPFGIIGLETALSLTLEELVATGKISLSRMVELFTTGPEAVMRLGRGTLAPGAPGDVTVFSTDVAWTYDLNHSHSRSRNSPFDGRTFRGGPVATVVNGEIVWQRG